MFRSKHREVHNIFCTNQKKKKKKIVNGKKITYKIKFVDSIRFMASSISNLAHNLAEGLHKCRCIDCKSCLEYVNVKDGLLPLISSDCNRN